MAEDTAVADDREASDRPGARPWHQLFVALSIGITLGAVALAVYAVLRRVPAGAIADRLGPATQLLVLSLALVVVAAGALVVIGLRAFGGRPEVGAASLTLTLVAAVTAVCFLSGAVEARGALLTGPGAEPVFDLARFSWVLLVVAAALALAGAVAADDDALPVESLVDSVRVAVMPLTALGLVAAVAVAFSVVWLANLGQPRPTTASAMGIAELPQTLGTEVAYRLTTRTPDFVVPAGSGFVLSDGTALVAHDGVSGNALWRFPWQALPDGCSPERVASTGTKPGAVVVIECTRTAFGVDPRYVSGNRDRVSFLVGLDAMTGRLLWSNDNGWSLRSNVTLPQGTVPVLNGTEIAALDPLTGQPRWRWSYAETDKRCGDKAFVGAVARNVIYVVACKDEVLLHRFDTESGEMRLTQLPSPVKLRPANDSLDVEPIALDGDVAVILVTTFAGIERALLAIDVESGDVKTLPADARLADYEGRKVGQYPGTVLQIGGDNSGPSTYADLLTVADRKSLRARDIASFSIEGVFSGQRWAKVGDSLVSANTYTGRFDERIASVAPDGESTVRPSPCGDDSGGVVAVPGAVLVLCQRGTYPSVTGYDVLGLR